MSWRTAGRKGFFECSTTGVVGGRGMSATRERSEIRKSFGKETRKEKKKHLKKIWCERVVHGNLKQTR